MNRLNGRPFRTEQFFRNQKNDLWGMSSQRDSMINYLRVISWSYLVLPLVTVLYWGGLIIFDSAMDDKNTEAGNENFLGGLSIILVGGAAITCTYTIMKVNWNNWRFKLAHMIWLSVSFSLFTLWQYVSSLGGGNSKFIEYLGLSVLFLTTNGLIVIAAIFLNLNKQLFNMRKMLEKYIPTDGDKPDPHRQDDFDEEVVEQLQDDNWIVTQPEIYDLVTIGKISPSKMLQAFGGGFQRKFNAAPLAVKRGINIGLAVLYFVMLVVYAWTVHYFDEGSKMGIVTALTVLIQDFYLFLLFNSRLIGRPSFLAMIVFASRILVYGGGATYWIYGYMINFMWLSFYLSWRVAQIRFPFSAQLKYQVLPSFKQKIFVDIARFPEFILILITVGLICTIAVVEAFQPEGVIFTDIDIPSLKLHVPYYATAGLCILFTATFFALACTYRAYLRRYHKLSARTYYYMFKRQFDIYHICFLCVYFLCLVWTLGFYWLTHETLFIIIGALLPAFLLSFFNGMLYYAKNDYVMLQDIKKLNKRADAHNKDLEKTQEKAKKIK